MSRLFSILALSLLTLSFTGCGGDSDSASKDNSTSTLDNQNQGEPVESTTTAASEKSRNRSSVDSGSMDDKNQTASNDSAFNNGLFPQIAASTSFGGALFPDMTNVSTEAAPEEITTPDGSDSKSTPADEQSAAADDMQPAADIVEPAEESISLLAEAKKLFVQHAEEDAIKVLYANYLISNEARSLYSLNWYPGLQEPRMLFRWGVGIVYKQPRDYSGRHPVIGDPGDENEGGGSSRGGRGGISSTSANGGGASRGSRVYKNIDTTRPDGFLLYYTGDFGENLIKSLDERRKGDAPHYGQILKDVLEIELASSEQEDDSIGRSGSQSGAAAASSSILSLGGESGGGRGSNRGNTSQPLDKSDISVIDMAMGQGTAEKPEDDFVGSIRPGVMLIGVGSKSDLIERADASNLDALIIFNVNVSQSRRSSRNRSSATTPSQTSSTSMKIIGLKNDGDNLFSSKALKDTVVKEKNDEGEDPVKKEIEKAFKSIADKEFKAQKLPESLNAGNVKKRIGALLKNEKDDPLPAAVEIISFFESKLLPEDLAALALTRLFDGSEEARVLINGTQTERLAFLKNWLPDSIEL